LGDKIIFKECGGWHLRDKIIFGMYVIAIATVLQLAAWYFGHNGQVFAFSSLIIGLTAGSILGFSLNLFKKKS